MKLCASKSGAIYTRTLYLQSRDVGDISPLPWQELVLSVHIQRTKALDSIVTLQLKLSWNLKHKYCTVSGGTFTLHSVAHPLQGHTCANLVVPTSRFLSKQRCHTYHNVLHELHCTHLISSSTQLDRSSLPPMQAVYISVQLDITCKI